MNSQYSLLYRYWHYFESAHDFQHLACFLLPSLSLLICVLSLLLGLFLLMGLLNILLLIYLPKTVEKVQNLVLYGVLLFALLCSLHAYSLGIAFHRALKLIWALLTALRVFRGITLKENIFDQLFPLVHDVNELSKDRSELFQLGHFII